MGVVANYFKRMVANLASPLGVGASIQTLPRLDLDEPVYEHAAAYYSNAYRACLLAKARPLSSLPVHVYRREGGIRREAPNGPARALEGLLRGRWNPFMTGAEGIRWAMMTKDTLGNAFIRVQWAEGAPVALWPMSGTPDIEVTPAGTPTFRYGGDKFTPPGVLLPYEVVWIKSPIIDSDGLMGVSLAKLAAEELGLSIDLERFYDRLLKNGSHFPGWLETDQRLDPADREDLRSQLSDGAGILSAGKIRIFEKGLSYHQTGLTMADMSLVEQERWILQQTCRTLSVPPQEVFDLSNATYSNIEQGSLNFANKTLVPECVTLEQAFGWVLECAGLGDCYVQLDMNGLLRGSYADRMNGYRTAILGGFMSANEVRMKEDMEPYEGGGVFFRSSAYIPVDPESGEELAQRSSERQPGAAGEGSGEDPGRANPGDAPAGAAENFEEGAAFIKRDMDERVAARFRDKGDCEATRDFAARVLKPYADACLMNRVEYDMESDIERLSHV